MDQPSSTENNAIVLRIKFKSTSLDEFIGRYGADVSPGGIFIRTRQPVEVGTTLKFDFTLADGSPLLGGTGTVAWVRESDPARPNNMPGMGLRFDKLSAEGQHMHQLILGEKARKEGKPLGISHTPSPLARLSPPPEAPRPAVEEPVKPVAVEEVIPAPVTLASPPVAQNTEEQDGDDFLSGGKTEISDKSIEQRLREMSEVGSGPVSLAQTSERSIPSSLLEDASGASELAAAPQSGMDADEPVNLSQPTQISPASVKPTSGERFASLMDLGAPGGAPGEASAVPAESLPELSGGTPIDENMADKTEPVVAPPPVVRRASTPAIDLGNAFPEPIRPSTDEAQSPRKPKSKGGGRTLVWVAVLGVSVAIAAVYLAKTKPWEQAEGAKTPATAGGVVALPVPTQAPVPATDPSVAQAPTATPPSEPAKPAVAEKPVQAEKPVVAEKTVPTEKPVVAEKPASDRAEGETQGAVEKTPRGKKPADKAVKPEPEPAKSAAKPVEKAVEKAVAQTSAENSPAAEDEVYRLILRSSPNGSEVLIDGEFYARTPCERRVLDPKKPIAILIRREGYESYERMLGPSDEWVHKGIDRFIRISAKLKKVRTTEIQEVEPPPAAAAEAKPAPAVKAEPAKPASIPAAAPAVAPVPAKPTPTLDESKKSKPAPNFE